MVGIHQMHRSVIALVNCSRSKASDGSDVKETSGCAQSSETIFLSFFMLLESRGK